MKYALIATQPFDGQTQVLEEYPDHYDPEKIRTRYKFVDHTFAPGEIVFFIEYEGEKMSEVDGEMVVDPKSVYTPPDGLRLASVPDDKKIGDVEG